jgi:hypothetical protein
VELKLATPAELRRIYETDLTASFPPAELRPLAAMERLRSQGRYRPWCLLDGGEIAGECLLWLGEAPRWALVDFLCVPARRRCAGLGARLLELVRAAEPERTLLGEAEAPEHAPDPAMAERRVGFYRRLGCRWMPFDASVFGVHYRLFYFAPAPLPASELLEAYREIYRTTFAPERFARCLRVPYPPDAPAQTPVPWEE